MASPDPSNSQKYGVPIYGSSWVPDGVLRSGSDDKKPSDDGEAPASAESEAQRYILLAGGGGEGRSGIPNALLLAHFDYASNSLSDDLVMRHPTGADLPYRMAVHPGGEGFICSFPKNCRWFEWDKTTRYGDHMLGINPSERELNQLKDVGQQLALTFNEDGSLLAVGGEDGYLRVFKWPSMELVLSDERAHSSVKDLDFSKDGKYLVSVGSGGPCRVWHVDSPGVVTSLPKENDEMFGYCSFHQKSDGSQILYTTTMHGKGGSIVQWNATTWRRISSKLIDRDPFSAFNVSNDGKLLAIGTIQGDIKVINSATMRVMMTVKKAHLGIVTTLAFSSDSRALVSASMDSSVRVTIIEETKKEGPNYWLIILMVLLAFIVYLMKTRNLLPIP
ncbi:hypothetical protein V2J09_015091 [Rumex salicifolius]